MTLEEMFDAVPEEEFLRFSVISNPPYSRRDVCAFVKLAQLVPGSEDIVSCGEHDQIWFGVDPEKLAETATPEDILYLVRCGVRYDDNADSLWMSV